MRSQNALSAMLTSLGLAAAVAGANACHVEAQIGRAQPPPSPQPVVLTSSPVVEPSPPPVAPIKKTIALKGVRMKSPTQIDMPGDIEFEKSSSKIVMNDKTKQVLRQLTTILKDNPKVTKLSIEGNSDNEGQAKGFDNAKLSQARAQSVVEWLTRQGIDAKRLSAVGNGSKNPVVPNDSPEHMGLNRRVEFHVREFSGEVTPVDKIAGAAPVAPAEAGAAALRAPAVSAPTVPDDAAKKPPDKDK